MGYMGLEKVTESDMAAEVMFDVGRAVLKVLKKEFKSRDDASEFNTSPIVNVVMNLNEFLEANPENFLVDDDFRMFAWNVIKKFEKYIEKNDKAEWGDAKNQRYHISAYKSHLKTLQDIIESFEEGYGY